ncbi:DUF6210 family protein [Polyangium sp. 6x1]|uniref:DUF6210 family protein n=1 Tax=Polyangium sp. 6x1 TaxID=3042689 RepID=UPI0024829919|nr:DUF6210 family protein [Polyangium sp. 6x1]MDI1444498.1 DUF6210 family protein [Polyangium sp. 6x1]
MRRLPTVELWQGVGFGAILSFPSGWGLSRFITVDRARLADSHEAWVWALVTSDGDDLAGFSGFGPYPRPAVLTWSNSD